MECYFFLSPVTFHPPAETFYKNPGEISTDGYDRRCVDALQTPQTDDTVALVRGKIRNDRRRPTVGEVTANDLVTLIGTCHSIMTNGLGTEKGIREIVAETVNSRRPNEHMAVNYKNFKKILIF